MKPKIVSNRVIRCAWLEKGTDGLSRYSRTVYRMEFTWEGRLCSVTIGVAR